jgi:hypothetical protein
LDDLRTPAGRTREAVRGTGSGQEVFVGRDDSFLRLEVGGAQAVLWHSFEATFTKVCAYFTSSLTLYLCALRELHP